MSQQEPDEKEKTGEGNAKPTITIAEKGGPSNAQAAEKETITIAEKGKPNNP